MENNFEIYKTIKMGNYTLGNVQDSILSILIEFDRICRKNNINYILDGGTMLGAVRHEGFIPWDDDADVAMLRKDYNKFFKACKKDLNPQFFLDSKKTNKKYPYSFAKLRLNNTVYKEKFLNNLDVHSGIWLDIFPIDNTNRLFFKAQCKQSLVWRGVRWEKTKVIDYESNHRWFFKVLSILPYSFINFFEELSIRFFNIFPSKYVSKLCHPGKGKIPHNKNYYKELIEYRFENHSFFIPKDYDEWLRNRYKNPYKMPDEKDRHPAHGGDEIKL